MHNVPLKIGFFADGIWGLNALKKLHKDKDFQICFFTPRFNRQDKALLRLAKSYEIPIIISENVNSRTFLRQIHHFHCDLLVSMSFNQIFKKDLLDAYTIINCHASKLPFYRGKNPLNWALINGEKDFGITVHFVDSGIDTGDIILQKSFTIKQKDDYSTLLTIAHTECANLLFKACKLFVKGKVKRISQESIDKIGSYNRPRKQGDEIIDFSKGTKELFHFIRALNAPDLGTLCFLGKSPLYLYESKIVSMVFDERLPNGFILAVCKKGFLLKCKDGVLKITKYRFKGILKAGLCLHSSQFASKSQDFKFSQGGGGFKNTFFRISSLKFNLFCYNFDIFD